MNPTQPSTDSVSRQSARRRVMFYIALLGALTILTNLIAARAGGGVLSSLVIMWSPGLAAIAASALTRRSLGEIGWRLGPPRWLAAGWLLPLLYALPAYGLVWLTGLGDVPSPTFLERARLTLGMVAEPDWWVIVSAFGYITIINLLPAMMLAVGEEIGWRGFLVPELTKWIGFRRAALASGLIWSAWHWPGVLTGAYGEGDTPLAYRVACFTAMVLTSSVVMAWLRMKSRSIWPVAIMHATHNGAIQAFFDRITADVGPTSYFIGEFGVAMVPFSLAIAWYCWRHADEAQSGYPSTEDGRARRQLEPQQHGNTAVA